jgi:hypothetical protein
MRRARPKRPVLIAQWKASHRKIEEALSMPIEYFLGTWRPAQQKRELYKTEFQDQRT